MLSVSGAEELLLICVVSQSIIKLLEKERERERIIDGTFLCHGPSQLQCLFSWRNWFPPMQRDETDGS